MNTVKYKGECYDLSKKLILSDPFLTTGMITFTQFTFAVTFASTLLFFIFARRYSFIPIVIGTCLIAFVYFKNKPETDIPGFIQKNGTKVTCPDMDKINECIDTYEQTNCPDLLNCIYKTTKGYNECIKENPCKSYEVCKYKGDYVNV